MAVDTARTTERSAAADAGEPLRRLLRLLRPHLSRLMLAAGASVLAELAALGLMGTAAWLIARAAQQPPIAALSLAIVGVRGFAVSRGAFRYVERLASHDAALRALATMRGRVYDALVPLAPSGLPAFRSSDLLSRMVADVEAVQDVVVRVLVPALTAGAVGALAIAFGVVVLPEAGLVLAAGLLVAGVLVPKLAGALSRRAAEQLAPARAELAARNVDLLHGSADLAVFGATGAALADAERAADDLARAERRAALTTAGTRAVAMLVQAAGTVGVTVLALTAATDGRLSAVMVPVLALLTLISFEPVLPLVAAARHVQEARTSARRVMAVLDARPPVAEPAEPLPAPGADAVIEVRDLRVRYTHDREPALDGVDLRLEPGRRVAVVGVSGSGKSTLLAALMRFVEPSSGSILIDGRDQAEYAGDDIRALITGVTQDTHLFHTTVRENLRLAAPSADEEEMRSALASARLLEWVDSLPRGLDTVVGEAGSQVSGGQRQRVALARALLADPPVIVLDEPTEGLEPDTADELVADLLASTRGRTTLLVTHRLAGLEQVDEIVVLDAGRVVQRGRHDVLLAVAGPYRDLYWAGRGGTTPERG
ncbi:thiol reductant ABC exporter subunit CydC [Phytoactinopolyspora halotolerans]|uniref:Thiol reductant ABC exporter subunit CydC n=1 Tax=Phytoactinopolyspora halotolerans TaxID=1981512 RepID=A0A6L9SB88_9ACTN|nr:thiol reductant ABC exporter subunit CydC [Phytoactinopolyspora halotolerans]NEE02536.1 thiol reductant ABC exporter subunit CydC [Phytoactinopolyspora halotolerans]